MSPRDSKKEGQKQDYSKMSDSSFGGKGNTDSMSDASFGGKSSAGSGSDSDKKAQEHHSKLNQQRVKDGKMNMNQATASNDGKKPSKDTGKRRKRTSAVAGAMNMKKNAQTVVAMGSAFTAMDPTKDWIHYLVMAVAILADIFTLVPLIGSAIAIMFILATWILYGMHGHFKKSPEKKVLVMLMCYGVEIIFSTAPTFIISAAANYWLALADRKVKANNQNS